MYTASFLQDPDFIRSLYIVAFVLFIIDLRLMNHPRTARKGNAIGAIGMGIAVIATLLIESVGDYALIALGIAIGTAVGVPAARSVKMTAMPQMVALFNGVGGGAVALISWVEYREALAHRRQSGARGPDPDPVRGDHRLGLVLGLEHRLREAPGDHSRPPDPAPGPAVHQHRAAGHLHRLLDRDRVRDRIRGPLHRDPGGRGDPRQHVRAADRRRRHARGDLAAERLHGAVRRGGRPGARQRRADRGRHARGRLRLDPHDADGRGDEPLDPQHLQGRLRRRRHRAGRGSRRRGEARALHGRRRRGDPARLREQGRGRAWLRAGGGAGAARGARPRERAREARRGGAATRSTRWPAGCRAT